MIRFLPLILVALLAGSAGAFGSDSLYDVGDSRAPGPALRAVFGPKSAGIQYDRRMIRAAEIALARAEPKKTWYCWRYVKNALLAAGLVSTRPTSAYAKQAGEELCAKYGFHRLNVKDPREAPVGAVIVYGGADAGHVELRTAGGYVSDFVSSTPYPRPLIGVFVKPS